jgi:hydrogenase expression/formation protein HypE
MPAPFTLSCPLPVTRHQQIVLGHGSGGRLTAQLVREIFLPAFDNPALRKLDDQAVLNVAPGRIALTTDSYVVTPLFFPGGDIGRLAVNGTVNDLAMSGARPLYLTAALIIGEALTLAELRGTEDVAVRIDAGVAIVTGDTKVVNRAPTSCSLPRPGSNWFPKAFPISASNAKAATW